MQVRVWTLAGVAVTSWPAPSTAPGVRVIALTVSTPGKAGFTLLRADQSGVTFTNSLDEWASAGNRVINNGSGVAAGDFDNDGLVDLFFCSLNQRNRLFKNLGHWQFKDVTDEAGLRFPPLFYRAAVFADLNGDSWLDLLVGTASRGVLCFNDGRAHFRSVLWTNGAFFDERENVLASTPLDWGLAAAFHDLNGDGAPDLYVCNDYWTPDRIWINGGRGRFKAIDLLAVRKVPASSMGVDFADINRDGHLDIFAVDMLSRSSELRRRQTVAKRPTAPRIGDIETRTRCC